MRVKRIGGLCWRMGTWIKDFGERKNIPELVVLGKRIRWGR